MRLHLYTTPNSQTVSYNNQQLLLSTLHKWLGKNKVHDEISLYSFSWLMNGQNVTGGLEFPSGSHWFINFYDNKLAKKCISGINKNPKMFSGLTISQVQLQKPPQFSKKESFQVASPVLVKYFNGKDTSHLTWEDGDKASEVMTRSLRSKLKKAGIKTKAKAKFDVGYKNPKTQLVTINNIQNRASMCPVILEGDRQAIKFAWLVGIGHSTGCGFGALK
ncbi:MAG: CRISPR-associated endoribonuclease Cas6 [Patescibacteria group bacterium]|nr:CRISPR-associated endoribonuclease Cas6 [Patescibacteria group bacterium]